MEQEEQILEEVIPKTEIDFSKIEGSIRIILQMVFSYINLIISKILETLSSMIENEEEKAEIEKLIHDYRSMDELLNITMDTLNVLINKILVIIETQKSYEGVIPKNTQYEYLALEKQLQKFEQESREHIRVFKNSYSPINSQNEQQLQIYADSLSQRIEDLEKQIQLSRFDQTEMKKKEIKIDELQKENQKLVNQILSLNNNQKKLEQKIEEFNKNKSQNEQVLQELEQKLKKQDLLLQNFLPVKEQTKNFPQSQISKSHSMQLLTKRTFNAKSHLNLQSHKLQDYSAIELMERQTGRKFNDNQLILNQQENNDSNNNSVTRKQIFKNKNSFNITQSHSTFFLSQKIFVLRERRNQGEGQLPQQYIGSQLPINPKFYNAKTQSLFTGQKNNVPISLMTQNSFLKSQPPNASLNYSQHQREQQNFPHVKDCKNIDVFKYFYLEIQKMFKNNNNNNKKRNVKKQQPTIGVMLKSNDFF